MAIPVTPNSDTSSKIIDVQSTNLSTIDWKKKLQEPKILIIIILILIVIIFGFVILIGKLSSPKNSSNTNTSSSSTSKLSSSTSSVAVLSTSSVSSSEATAPLLPKSDVYWAKFNTSTPPMLELVSTSRPLDPTLKNIDKIEHLLTILVAGTDITESNSGMFPTFTLTGASSGDCGVVGGNLEFSEDNGKLKIRFCKDIVEKMEDTGYAGISLQAQHRVLSAIDKTLLPYLAIDNLKLEIRTKDKKCYGKDADGSGEINVCDDTPTVSAVPDCTVQYTEGSLSETNAKYTIKYSYPKMILPDNPGFNQVNIVLYPGQKFDQTKVDFAAATAPNNTAVYTDEMKYDVKFNCKKILSVYFKGSAFTGGAHPNNYNSTYNFNLNTGAIIHLEDLFASYNLAKLQTAVFTKLNSQYSGDLLISDATKLTYNMLQAYYIDNAGVHFVFDPYVVASYATGTVDIVVDTTSVKYSPLLDCILGVNTTVCGGGD